MNTHTFALACVLMSCASIAVVKPLSGAPTTAPTTAPATSPTVPRTTIVFQKSLNDAQDGNIVILRDLVSSSKEFHPCYFAILVDAGADQVVYLGDVGPIDPGGRFLDAWLPPNGTLITVTCDSTATMYRASFCDGRPDRTFGGLIMFPEGSFKPDKPLRVQITGSRATKDETVTFWEDQHGWKWKFRFDPDAHKWVTEEKPKNLPFKVQYPLVNPP